MAKERRGLPVLLVGAALLGLAAIFVRWATGVSPLAVGFYRMLFALPLVLLFAFREGRPAAGAWRSLAWAVLGGLCFTSDLWLWHQALHWTTAASATLLVGLAPLWVALAGVLFLRFRLSSWGWVGLLLALGGAAVLALASGAQVGSGRGELFGFLASFGYAGYMLSLSKARRGLSAPWALAGVVVTSLFAFGALNLAHGHAFGGYPPRAWMALLGLGLVVQVLAWWLITWGFGHLSASLGSQGLLFQQVATVLLGWLLLGEAPGALQGVGIFLILAGIALAAANPPMPIPKSGKRMPTQ
jgi:drug/metabolite transporter (DMT)-like permease